MMLEVLDHIDLGQYANEVNALKMDQVEFRTRIEVQGNDHQQRLHEYTERFRREEEDLQRRLEDELDSVKRLSAKKIIRAQEYSKTTGGAIRGPAPPPEPTTAAPLDPQQRVVEFWKAKHAECAAELAHMQSQVMTYRNKISDIRQTMDGDPSKLRCSVAAVRDRLLQERARTSEYRRLVDEIRESGSTTARARKVLLKRAGAENGDENDDIKLTTELAQEDKRNLQRVENILTTLHQQRQNYVTMIEKRKALLTEMIGFFEAPFDPAMLEGINVESPVSPTTADTDNEPVVFESEDPEVVAMLAFEGLPSLETELNEVTARYHKLLENYHRDKREKRVTMIRQMDEGIMSRWIDRIHLNERAKVMEAHIDVATRDKASLLFQIDQISTNAKTANSFGKRL